MSLFDWLMPKSRHPKQAVSTATNAVLPRQTSSGHAATTPDTDLKTQRQERRERLYAVVREAMLRSEVLASRYKFKVLSLDTHGRQFLVMVDLLDARAVPPERFSTIEQLIISHAAQQHGMYVKSVYWRVNELATVAPPTPAPHGSAQVERAATPVPQAPRVAPQQPTQAPVFDPIDQAEVLAFKKAIGALPSAKTEAIAGQLRTSGPHRPSVRTGYEDTQLLESPEDQASPLSRTQFGDL
jgi:hypothetical protein